MSQDNQFHQYGYDHYLKAPKRGAMSPLSGGRRGRGKGISSRLMRKLQSPAVATVALLAAGALFVGVIYATYPSSENAQQEIPIVKADLEPIRMYPEDRGGMDIPNKDSTLLARVGQAPVKDTPENIENLLAQSKEDLISKERALQQAMAFDPDGNPVEDVIDYTNVDDGAVPDDATVVVLPELNEDEVDEDSVAAVVEPVIKEPELKEPALKEPAPGDILQKIGATQSEQNESPDEFARMAAQAALVKKPQGYVTAKKPEVVHPAGTSPETLDFVRGVLNSPSESDTAAAVEPAAGAAISSGAEMTSGVYFVQLASITDPARAASEWTKMQNKYGVLSHASFRVQEAALSSGTFYRIQAGPMSKSQANEICGALKNAGKPGGCLVVK